MTGLCLLTAVCQTLLVTAPINPASVEETGMHRWQLSPLDDAVEYAGRPYSAIELMFKEPPDSAIEVVAGLERLHVEAPVGSVYFLARSESLFQGENVLLTSEQEPTQAAFLFTAMPIGTAREPFRKIGPDSWNFFTPGTLPRPWELSDSVQRLGASDTLPYVTFRANRADIISTGEDWHGTQASYSPVAVIQMQVGSGVGSGSFMWETNGSRRGSWIFRIPRRGEWAQVVLPLIRHPLWKGGIQWAALSPVNHEAVVSLDWIQLPRVSSPWALLLRSSAARWACFVCSFLICWAILLAKRPASRDAAFAAAIVGSSAILPLFLPFDELRPSLHFGPLEIPSYVVLFGMLALYRVSARAVRLVDAAAWSCVVVTLALGLVVANGAGIGSAVQLISMPLGFLAGRVVAEREHSGSMVAIILGVATLLCLHAAAFSSAQKDPLYGSVLMSLGRAYWDATVFGRSAGSFVHPLVLAGVAVTMGTLLMSSRFARRPISILAVGALFLGGACSGSRSFLLLLIVTLCVAMYKGRRRLAVLAAASVVVAVLSFLLRAPDDQGPLRSLHLGKRAAGLQVAVKTIAAKPVQGVGWGRYSRAVQRFGPRKAKVVPFTTPDNSLARFFTEGGILGGSVWVVWIILLFREMRKPTRDPSGYLPHWTPVAALVVIWSVFDAAYWPAASVPVCCALGAMTE